ncbi:acyl transferase domain-containing protein/enoyl-CoA hydratase/carnithine racemase/acyl carrier protein, partial [Aquimarina sp. EL_43]
TTRSKYIELESPIEGVLTIRIATGDKNYKLKTLISGLEDILNQLENTSAYKVLVLSSTAKDFLRVSKLSSSVEEIKQLQNLLINAPVPVIAAFEGNATDIGWLLGQCCDVCIYHTEGIYSASGLVGVAELGSLSLPFFVRGLGDYLAQEVLLTGREYSGLDLQQHTGSVVLSADPITEALDQAGYWSSLPIAVIRDWKKAQQTILRSKLDKLPIWIESEEVGSTSLPEVATEIELRSEVIKATLHPEGIVEIKMEDREAKNMFSDAFMEGMIEIFDHIAASSIYKVVILTGYDSYFASGGTKESLLAIQEGKAKFTDTKIFQLALDCNIPVIASMQGHGIGAGWSMGMFSDFPILSTESHYVSPYMNYGFTPGAGSTLIFLERIGYDLARGTLLTGIEYSGAELNKKGVSLPVVSRKEIGEFAFALARELTRNTRDNLIAFKHQMTHDVKGHIEDICARELTMHDETFVGRLDTLALIEDNFKTTSSTKNQQFIKEKPVLSSAKNTPQGKFTLPMVINKLKLLLVGELHLEEEEIDEDSQFVDLGLDSIVGVTFIRKINELYHISLQATIVYSYSTLSALSAYVLKETREQEKEVVVSIESSVSTITSTNTVLSNERRSNILSDLRQLLARELHLEEEEIDEGSQFVDLGLDSIVGVTFIRKINEMFGVSLQATIVYSYATLSALSGHIQQELGVQVEEVSSPTVDFLQKEKRRQLKQIVRKELSSWRKDTSLRNTSLRTDKGISGGIAIIGMSGQFPKAENVDVFWQNIAGGKDCISEIPEGRWDIDKYYEDGDAVPGKTYSKWMGALEGYDLFDPMFFNISPVEAESMDPQQRLFLQSCWHTIEYSGYNPHAFSGSKCGVYVGCAYGDYQMLSREDQLSAQGFTGGSTSILAARISYFLNLQGPCISMDTACSSSLVAIANACDALVSGSIDAALAGGVYVMAGPDMHIKAAQSGMLSPDGKCHTFDQQANGFVPGEGVGTVMLKRIEDAEKDGDNILGVIRGWGVNQDGKTNGITAPNTESQTLLEQQVYDQFQIDPNNIQLIETHGTGTKLGDPIEIEGLRKTFKKYTQEKEYCALGSIKSNIGHCLTAAGVAGVIKVLQSLKHQQLPPTINFEQLNEHINLDDSPFYVNTKLRDWKVEEGQQRQAAISSFGFSGTNAHLVLEEYVPEPRIADQKSVQVVRQDEALMIPLSARSEEQLQQKASDLLSFVKEKKGSLNLLEMSYTLQVGREAMEERLGFMISEVNQLIEKLQDYIQGKENINGVYRGQVKRNKEGLRIISNDDDMKETIIDNYINQRKLSKLLDLWVKGLELDWNKLYGDHKPNRINLPLYPFARERYWVDSVEEKNSYANGITTSSILHPLLHANTSDFSKQSYSATFSGKEFFLKDHQVFNQKVLPGVAYLEMARTAIEKSMPSPIKSAILELNNIIWIQPFAIIDEKKQINIILFLDDSNSEQYPQIDYEIYSHNKEEDIIHFQGKAIFSNQTILEKIDIDQLRDQMTVGKLAQNNIYNAFAQMGLQYGLAHQGIQVIYQGERQVLANLTLPETAKNEQNNYLLHPSLMDSALQATIGLFQNLDQIPEQPLLPFALGSLRIISACVPEMVVWARYAKGSKPGDKLIKVDLDLCDQEGNIGVQIREMAFRVMKNEKEPMNTTTGDLLSRTINGTSTFNDAYYQSLIQSVLNKELSDEEAVELV